MDTSNTIFSGRFNFLKIYSNNSGTFTVSSASSSSILLETHGLGYIPRVKVWYEPISGELWPLVINQYDNSDGGPGTTLTKIGNPRVTSNELYVDITNISGVSSDVVFRWRIYLDE